MNLKMTMKHKTIFTCVKIALGTLKRLIREAFNIKQLVNRPSKIAIINFRDDHHVGDEDDYFYIVAIDNAGQAIGSVTLTPNEDNVMIVDTLWSNDPTTTMGLLMSALEIYHGITPSHSVSNAARQVINRYFEAHKDDPDLIDGTDPLKAYYWGPIGFDVKSAQARGEAILKANNLTARDVINNADKGFGDAFNNPDKTRRKLPDFSSITDPEDLVLKLAQSLNVDQTSRFYQKALEWYHDHEIELAQLLANDPHKDVLTQSLGFVWDTYTVEVNDVKDSKQLIKMVTSDSR